ncbi:MAG: GntR family transcriptional regulator [Nakamurella sp.]
MAETLLAKTLLTKAQTEQQVPPPTSDLDSRHLPDLSVEPVQFDRAGPDPLHTQIEQFLRERIVSGHWASRRRLPPEPELAAQLGVNRGTLRRALAALIRQGLLVPLRGRGTFVAPIAQVPTIAQRFRSLTEDLAAQGFSFTRQVRSSSVGRLPLAVQTVLGATPSTQGLRLERVFTSTEGPLAYLVNYVRTDRCPGIEQVDFERVALFDTLATTYGVTITEGRRTLSAQAATEDVATALAIELGTATLFIEQVSFTDSGEAIEYSDVWINSNLVTITAVLQRD